jgi:ubiquinone/menaquinone biosynthesis C-methylase UbiE
MNLTAEDASLLCDPLTHDPIRFDKATVQAEALINTASGRRFPLRSGIPIMLEDADSIGQNLRYQRLYDQFAGFYDLAIGLFALLRGGGLEKRRREYLDEMEIEPGARVLEVSVGTGMNLRFLPRMARYFGLDISWGMLRRCQKNLHRWGIDAFLVQGAAEHLPFVDGAFDAVLHMGGINFFNDKAQALREMVRVAKPGTKFVIVDETEQITRNFAKVPGAGAFYSEQHASALAPVDFLPPGMRDVQVKTIAKGDLYCLTFRSPR